MLKPLGQDPLHNKMAVIMMKLVAKGYILWGIRCDNMKVECESVKDKMRIRE